VILHVVWDSERGTGGALPCLRLREALDAPLGQLSLWLGNDNAFGLPEELRGKCCAPLRDLTQEQQEALFRQAAMARLQSKAAQFQARAKQAGWEQALWEGLFRALGFKHNTWPMQRLGELRPRWSRNGADRTSLEARLFGISGLLPAELPRSQPGADDYVRLVWDQWWRERDEFADCILPKTLWRFHGIRPANHPQRRLALASGWAQDGKTGPRLERWCAGEVADKALPASLLGVLQVDPNDFWARHCTFHSRPLKRAQPLIGVTRVTDLAVNVVLPWLWVRAAEGKNVELQRKIEHRYSVWPPAEDNSLLRLARQRLLGGAHRRTLSSAAVQQGVIQIIRDFCEHSNSLCEKCKFPKMVTEFVGSE